MPHLSTTVFGGTPKIFQPFGSLPASPASATTLLWSSASFFVTGPARFLLLVVEEVPGLGRLLVGEGLLTGEQRVERLRRDRESLDADRRRHEVRLEVVELELRRLAEDPDHLVGVLDAGDLDRDLVVALLPDLGLRDTEPVDAVAQDLDRPGEVGLLQLPVRRRHRLEGHLEAALEVEAERGLLVDRRAGNREQADPNEPGDDQRHESEVRSTVHRASGRLAADLLVLLCGGASSYLLCLRARA